MRFGSVCSGIEAASVAWLPLGWQAAWFSEIEPFPCAALAHHYPTVPNHGDMSTLPARIRAGAVEAPDLFCGGTPCQAFSVAGLRKSLSDERGNLSLTFVEIADAIDDVRRARGDAQCLVFWENVPGVLNTADNAFGCFLGALAGCDTAIEPLAATGWTDAGVVAGPTRTVAWRVLDAQYFGLAQRRRRVFVVASAREGFDPAAVLLEWEGVRRDSAPSREARKVAPTIPARSTGGGGLGSDFDLDGGIVGALYAGCGPNGHGGSGLATLQGALQAHLQAFPDPAYAITGGPDGRQFGTGRDAQDTFVTHSLRGEGFDASEDGTGRGTPLVPLAMRESGQGYWMQDEIAGTLRAEGEDRPSRPSHVTGVPVPMINMQGSKGNAVAQADGPSFTLNAMHGHDMHAVAVPVLAWQPGNVTRGAGSPPSAEVFPTLKSDHGRGASDQQPHVLAFSSKDHGADATADLAPTLRAMNHADSHANGGGQMAVAFQERGREHGRELEIGGDVAYALTAPNGGGRAQERNVMTPAMQVRRLTPRECERLQGFPDDYTAIPWRNKPASECPDGPRYKALGNSWAVPVVRWIGRRIQQHCGGAQQPERRAA